MKRALAILFLLTAASVAVVAAPPYDPPRLPTAPPFQPAPNAVGVPEPLNLLMAGAAALVGLRLLRKKFTV